VAVLCGRGVEAPDFAGMDLGYWHLDGIFSSCRFPCRTRGSGARRKRTRARPSSASEQTFVRPPQTTMRCHAARAVLARFMVLPGGLRCDVEANEFFGVLRALEFHVLTEPDWLDIVEMRCC
jgi:hypothetical protein